MNIDNYIKILKNIYKIFPEYIKIIDNMLKSEITLLYFLDNINLEVELSYLENNNNKNNIFKKEIIYNKKTFDTIIYLYQEYLKPHEIDIFTNNKNFYLFINKITVQKNKEFNNFRKNIILTSLLHKNTQKFINRFYINNKTTIKNMSNNFFDLKKILHKKFKSVFSHGIIIDGSVNLMAHNIRKNKDIDLVILHPYFESPNTKKILQEISQIEFIDPFFHGIIEWDGENKEFLDKNTSEITKNKINNYYEMIFDPKNYYYFFGIKIMDFNYDITYRSIRSYPKNIAELILTKDLLNINLPHIHKLNSTINVEDKTYSINKFIKVAFNYYIRFTKYIHNPKYNTIDEFKIQLQKLGFM